MGRSIGQVIRELRKRDKITQEKLAEALNVSFQSVSRWENDLTYPDISLIPVLARYFHVTADELLDMNIEEHQRSKETYERLYKGYRKDGELELCRDIMFEARKEFPRDCHIMMNLAEALDLYENGTKLQQEEFAAQKYSDIIYSLCQSVLEDSREAEERFRAIKLLCEYYVKRGNHVQARLLSGEVADMEHCREHLMEQMLSGEERMRQLQHNILQSVDYAAVTMVKIAFQKEYGFTEVLTVDEKIQYVKQANKLYELLMPDGNYQFYHRTVGWNCRRLAELYLLKEDTDKAFEYLLLAEKEATRFDELQAGRYTSLFLNKLKYEPETHCKSWSGSERAMLLYRVKELHHYFGEHEGMRELTERLAKATAQEKAIEIE